MKVFNDEKRGTHHLLDGHILFEIFCWKKKIGNLLFRGKLSFLDNVCLNFHSIYMYIIKVLFNFHGKCVFISIMCQ